MNAVMMATMAEKPPTAVSMLPALLRLVRPLILCIGAFLALGGSPVGAQQMDHSKMQMAPAVPPAKQRPAAKPAEPRAAANEPARAAPVESSVDDPQAGYAMPAPTPARTSVDHAAMGHAMPESGEEPEAVDHAAMGHAMPESREEPEAVDNAAMGHAMPESQDQIEPMDHAAMGHDMPAPSNEPRTPIPVLTEEDRAAAFPDVAGHAAHDRGIHSFWLVDRLEAFDADAGTGLEWEALSWIGTDLDRLWLRSEGEYVDDAIETADVEVLYGRNVARWWDVVAGVRHDFGESPSQTFAAFGVMGLSPYKFEIEATGYIGQSGQTAARFEAEYDTLLTNRLILQWLAEAELYGKSDASRGIGSGLSTVELGLRLRYEFTRRFAPYIGIVWERAFGDTADFRREDNGDIDDTRIVAGVRIWF